jgi:hypothetical protein
VTWAKSSGPLRALGEPGDDAVPNAASVSSTDDQDLFRVLPHCARDTRKRTKELDTLLDFDIMKVNEVIAEPDLHIELSISESLDV